MPPRRLPASLAALLAAAAPVVAAGPDPGAALPDAVPPLVRAGAVERHTPDTLWERIDGEAELYRVNGLESSAHAAYEDPGDPDRRVVLSSFAFADPLGAFGLFAAFRPAGCPGGPPGNGACLGDYQAFFWHGRLFVLADAAGEPETRRLDLRRAVEAAAAGLAAPPAPPALLERFERFADPATVQYRPSLLGRSALPAGLEGEAGGLRVFVAGPGAAGALDGYGCTLPDAARGSEGGVSVLSGTDPLLGPVLLLEAGGYIAGARSATEPPGLRGLLEDLARDAPGR